MKKTQGLVAFTLAEVLITLGIIGIVAAMTIPALLYKYQDMQYKSAYKKAFALAEQALMIANQQDSLSSTSGEGDTQHVSNFLAFMSQFKVSKQCIQNNHSECWDDNGEKDFNGQPSHISKAFLDSSGYAWSMYYDGCFRVYVDTNAFNKPNQWGKDRFGFSRCTYTGCYCSSNGTPLKFIPLPDNNSAFCWGGSINKCATAYNYYGTSWLQN